MGVLHKLVGNLRRGDIDDVVTFVQRLTLQFDLNMCEECAAASIRDIASREPRIAIGISCTGSSGEAQARRSLTRTSQALGDGGTFGLHGVRNRGGDILLSKIVESNKNRGGGANNFTLQRVEV